MYTRQIIIGSAVEVLTVIISMYDGEVNRKVRLSFIAIKTPPPREFLSLR